MNSVLILTDVFPPGFAPRMGYLSKYLSKYGWYAEVIAPVQNNKCYNFNHLSGYIPYHPISEKDNSETSNRNLFIRRLFSLKRMLNKGIFWYSHDTEMYSEALKIVKGKSFNIILCSTSAFFPLEVAYRLSRKFEIPLILDFRDIFEQSIVSFGSSFGLKMQIMRRNKIISYADAIITVSAWHRNFLKEFNKNSYLIYNGYDPDLFYYCPPLPNKKFIMTYTGTILPFGDFSKNPHILFKSVANLLENKIINPDNLKIRFYTDDRSKEYIEQLSGMNGLEKSIEVYDWILASEIPEILSESSILLIFSGSFSQTGTYGVLTTKLFEYLPIGRYILCVPGDDSFIEEILKDTNAGSAVNTQEETCIVLKNKYLEWLGTGMVKSNVNFQEIKKYSRDEQAKQFAEILNQYGCNS